MSSRKSNSASDQYYNVEIVTITVFLLGGSTSSIDTEDVAMKANELAPGRFAWRKYSDQINIELIRTFLSDAKKEKNGAYLSGTGNDGWMLTPDGLAFAEVNSQSMGLADMSRTRVPDQKWFRRERTRLLSSETFRKVKSERQDEISLREAEGFFRIDEYVTGSARERKITRLLNAFHDDTELGPVVRGLAQLVEDKTQ